MSEWLAENPEVVEWFLKQLGEEGKLPVLVLQPNKIYKLRLLENPQKVEGTEGYMVKVNNEADGKEYVLFLQRVLAARFREIEAKKGDILAVVNKGRNMQTGYEYTVGHWRESFDRFLARSHRAKKNEEKNPEE